MPELTFKSAGISTREIDLTGPTGVSPSGVPAGVIGTANRGPAFVPITVATIQDFVAEFGETDAEKFGPIAVVEWLKNAKSATFMRLLGAGDGKKAASDGKVTNAGFVVGAQQVQATGKLANSIWANSTDGAQPLGRTYFLGCLMSESNHSKIFSDAAMQEDAVQAKLRIAVNGYASLDADSMLRLVDGAGNVYSASIAAAKTNVQCTSTAIGFSSVDSAAKLARSIYGSIHHAITYGVTAGTSGSASGGGNKLRMEVNLVSDDTKIHLTQSIAGPVGNTTPSGSILFKANGAFLGLTGSGASGLVRFGAGSGGAIPIIRGVLLAPSGVTLTLSGAVTAAGSNNQTPAKTTTATVAGPFGFMTGSVNIRNGAQEFAMLLNGHIGSGLYPNVITASFDIDSANYIANVFNTDPTKIEDAGHMLYTHYDIHPAMAALTGSGVLCEGGTEVNGSGAGAGAPIFQDAAFLLSGTLARNTDASNKAPNYENFETRYQTPFSPWVISQKFGGSTKNLFKIHARDDGSYANHLFKISIENIQNSKSDINKYGTFDLLVRDFNDLDTDKKVIEQFRALSLDPTSDRYIGRIVGDRYTYFDFDKKIGAQKLITKGEHPNNSSYIRLEMATDVTDAILDQTILPVGFRGHHHLVTSGTECLTVPSSHEGRLGGTSAGLLKSAATPPVPYRSNIKTGRPPKESSDSSYYWGVQFEKQSHPLLLNKSSEINKGIRSFTKYFSSFQKTYQPVWAGNNAGVDADTAAWGVRDCDEFQKALFTLENLKIRTGSAGTADAKQWHSASYVRGGGIETDHSAKTRRFSVATDLSDNGTRKFAKFSFFVQGGFDGVNIFDEDKAALANNAVRREMDDSNQGESAGPTVSAYHKALEIIGSKADCDVKLLAIPGIRHEIVTDRAIDTVESRFDAMYLMDIEERDVDNTVVTSSLQDVGVNNTISAFKDRSLDTSFAAAYFPDVVVKDPFLNVNVQVPPSVAVLGAFSLNDSVAHPWYAPAGFTRGALDPSAEGRKGAVNLSRANLDTVYDSDVNPLTSFPGSKGLVVWGQKTLLARKSSLDRVNVRRLLIELRRQVKAVANTILFEPNRTSTLARFSGMVQPILTRVQEQQGLDRFKVVIDTTTTTQADVENNTIRGKIFLQPTRVAEFISLDFVLTNAGAEI